MVDCILVYISGYYSFLIVIVRQLANAMMVINIKITYIVRGTLYLGEFNTSSDPTIILMNPMTDYTSAHT